MDELIKQLRDYASATNEVADLLEAGKVELAESAAALYGVAFQLRNKIQIEGAKTA